MHLPIVAIVPCRTPQSIKYSIQYGVSTVQVHYRLGVRSMLPTDYPPSYHTGHNSSQNIIAQAKAGSIAAIIQLLNESLSHLKVRTRAVLEKRSLLLLCEAESEEALEAEVIVPHLRQVLEAIGPQKIRRVHFFSRLTREQQMLWTTEIARSTQVLWSQEIVLQRPSLFKQFQDQLKFKDRPVVPSVQDLPRRLISPAHGRPVWPALVGAGLLGLALLGGITIAVRRLPTLLASFNSPKEPIPAEVATIAAPSPTAIPKIPPAANPDPFVEAVRIAEQAASDGKAATTRSEWLALAARWQEASDLMAKVAAEDDRYKTAQDRVAAYRKNSEAALTQANQL